MGWHHLEKSHVKETLGNAAKHFLFERKVHLEDYELIARVSGYGCQYSLDRNF